MRLKKVAAVWQPVLWLLVLMLLVAHVGQIGNLRVDNSTVLLLVLLALIPQVARLRRMKFMDLEAEIDPQEVRELAVTTRAATQDGLPPQSPQETARSFDYDELLDRDPNLALAHLRMDLEGSLRALAESLGPLKPRTVSAAGLARFLAQHEALSEEQVAAVLDVVSVCNRAIHGAQIDRATAAQVVEAGTLLLRRIKAELYVEPSSVSEIDGQERDHAMAARYRVETVVPLVDHPKRHVYLMTQEQLDKFLEGYEEYAEFLTKIERIDN